MNEEPRTRVLVTRDRREMPWWAGLIVAGMITVVILGCGWGWVFYQLNK